MSEIDTSAEAARHLAAYLSGGPVGPTNAAAAADMIRALVAERDAYKAVLASAEYTDFDASRRSPGKSVIDVVKNMVAAVARAEKAEARVACLRKAIWDARGAVNAIENGRPGFDLRSLSHGLAVAIKEADG